MPKTYKTEIIGYTFSELSADVQQRLFANDEYFSHSVDFEPVEEDFRTQLAEYFGADLETLEVYYDVSHSQGSGACCVGELDVETVFDNRVGSYFTKLLDLIESGKVTIDAIKVVRCGPWNFYSHENTCRVDVHYSCDSNEVGDWEGEDITELEEILTNAIREELCNFHSKLQDHYEESASFEAYCDNMTSDGISGDVVYLEDGSVVDPVFIKDAYVLDGYQLPLDFDE